MFFAYFLELFLSSRYNKGRDVFAILRYLSEISYIKYAFPDSVEKFYRFQKGPIQTLKNVLGNLCTLFHQTLLKITNISWHTG